MLVVDKQNNLGHQPSPKPSQDELKQRAVEFEAVLLMRLTSALNSSNDDEESLFGSDGGSGLARQMFSEQLATTIAEAGGIGLAEIIMRQLSSSGLKKPPLAAASSAVKDIKADEAKDIAQTLPAAPAKIEAERQDTPLPAAGAIYGRDAQAPGQEILLMPLNGRVSSGFGNRFHPVDKKTKFHAGLDIAAPRGTPISAAADGTVKFAGWSNGYGNLVILRHADGRETRYGHSEKLFVKEGDMVRAGEKIAAVGSTGKSTGPHLHFEVRRNGVPLDPKNFLTNVLPGKADR